MTAGSFMARLSALWQTRAGRAVMITLASLIALALLGAVAVAVINGIVIGTTKDRILSPESAAELADVELILVLGAGVKPDGSPTDMLRDRVLTGVALVDAGAAGPLLMSGDNQHPDYDEVGAMVALAVECGVGEERILTDRLGLSTYESLARAKEQYGEGRILVVTQQYHLYRALYIAESLGFEAYGVSADLNTYWGQTARDVREVAARCKDLIVTLFD